MALAADVVGQPMIILKRLDRMLRLSRSLLTCGTTSTKLVSALNATYSLRKCRATPGSSTNTWVVNRSKSSLLTGGSRLGWSSIVYEPASCTAGSSVGRPSGVAGRVQIPTACAASRAARSWICCGPQASNCPSPWLSRSGDCANPPSMSRFLSNGWSEYSEL